MRRSITAACVAAAAAATAAGAAPALAQTAAPSATLEQRLDASLRLIEALQRRVDELERRGAPTAASAERAAAAERVVGSAPAPAPTDAAPAVAPVVVAPAAGQGLALHGFLDVGAGVRNRAAAGSASRNFSLGVIDLYMTPTFGANLQGLVEVALEFERGGGVAVDVERLQLGRAFSDALTVWAGRFHTPFGHWNTAFHHGAQLQTSLSRPRFLEFEDKGGVLPTHAVGLWATGAVATGLGRLGYDVYAFNGNRIDAGVLDFQAAGDGDGGLGVGVRASLALAGTPWKVGVHGQRQRVAGSNADASASGTSRVGMLGGFVTFDNDDWEAMAEVFGFRNAVAAGGAGTRASRAWYVQVGRTLAERFTPYLRLERAALDPADPYFALQDSGRSYRRAVAGLRYDVNPTAALKAEWTRTTEDGTPGTPSSLAVQYAVRF